MDIGIDRAELFGEYARHAGLARPARTHKEVRMPRVFFLQGPLQSFDDRLLAQNLLERAWVVPLVERRFLHGEKIPAAAGYYAIPGVNDFLSL